MSKISEEIINDIKNRLIEPSYRSEVERLLYEKKNWKKSGQVFEVSSKVFLALGSIISFSAGFYQDIPILSFVSGSVSVVSLSLLQFSSFCYLEHKRQSNELNVWLKKLGLEPMPVLARDINIMNDSDNNGVYMRTAQSLSPARKNSYKYNSSNSFINNIQNENEFLKQEIRFLTHRLEMTNKDINISAKFVETQSIHSDKEPNEDLTTNYLNNVSQKRESVELNEIIIQNNLDEKKNQAIL
jgi:hypothetical protein